MRFGSLHLFYSLKQNTSKGKHQQKLNVENDSHKAAVEDNSLYNIHTRLSVETVCFVSLPQHTYISVCIYLLENDTGEEGGDLCRLKLTEHVGEKQFGEQDLV